MSAIAILDKRDVGVILWNYIVIRSHKVSWTDLIRETVKTVINTKEIEDLFEVKEDNFIWKNIFHRILWNLARVKSLLKWKNIS